MKNRFVIAAAAILALSASAALAASPAAQSAAKAISQITADASKQQAYCEIVRDMDAAGEDEAKLDELGEQLDGLLESFGPQYVEAMQFAAGTDPDSADGKAIDAAFDDLDEKCWE